MLSRRALFAPFACLALAAGAAPSVQISFAPATITVGGTSTLQVDIAADNLLAIASGAIPSFTYAPGVVNAANAIVGNTCVGLVTALPGAGGLSLTGLGLPLGKSCRISIAVTASAGGAFTTTFPAGGLVVALSGNSVASSATLTVNADPLIVTSEQDSGPGSLRAALDAANKTCVPDKVVIRFAIDGANPHVIRPLTELPPLHCDGAIIDGYSQPGARANTRTDGGNDAALAIVLDGSACASGGCDGITLDSTNTPIVRGLAIHSFANAQAHVKGNGEVLGNYLGVAADGQSGRGGKFGVFHEGQAMIVGGSLPSDLNVIRGNATGIFAHEFAVVSGNLVTANGEGIRLDAHDNRVLRNFVTGNTGAGIATHNPGDPNFISMNSVWANGGLGIDVGANGPTAFDARNRTNAPSITSVRQNGNDTVVSGTLQVGSSNYAVIELFANDDAQDAEGRHPIASFGVTLANNAASFTYTASGVLATNVTATASADNNTDTSKLTTSEFSAVVAASAAPPSGPSAPPPPPPAPLLVLNPASLTFADRTVGTRSPAQAVTLANRGDAALEIASMAVNGDFSFSSDCPAMLVPSNTCEVSVVFAPLAAGSRMGNLVIASNAASSPQSIALLGTGEAAPVAAIEVSPPALDFPPQDIGSASDAQLVRIANSGNAPLSLDAISLAGDFERVALPAGAGAAACGASLDPGASCAIAIVFRPRDAQLRTGLLEIANGASSLPTDVRLFGTGREPAAATPGPTPAPTPNPMPAPGGTPAPVASGPVLNLSTRIEFEPQLAGSASEPRPLTIVNTSDQAVSIVGLTVTGDFSASANCTTIAPHSRCVELVTFLPSAAGERSGTLTLRLLSEAQPYVVQLRGEGASTAVPSLSLSATRMGFGNTLIDTMPHATVVVVNRGEADIAIDGVDASGDFAATSQCGAMLARGASCSIDVTFSPRLVGGRAGSIEIRSNASGSPHRVDVNGVGCAIPSIMRSRSGTMLCGS